MRIVVTVLSILLLSGCTSMLIGGPAAKQSCDAKQQPEGCKNQISPQ